MFSTWYKINVIESYCPLLDKQQVMNKHTFKGLISGLSAVGLLYSGAEYPDFSPVQSAKNQDRDNMRGDWQKIGGDFSTVIKREKFAKEKSIHQ